jgi:hypothetical protein
MKKHTRKLKKTKKNIKGGMIGSKRPLGNSLINMNNVSPQVKKSLMNLYKGQQEVSQPQHERAFKEFSKRARQLTKNNMLRTNFKPFTVTSETEQAITEMVENKKERNRQKLRRTRIRAEQVNNVAAEPSNVAAEPSNVAAEPSIARSYKEQWGKIGSAVRLGATQGVLRTNGNTMSMCKIPPTTLVAFNINSQLIQQNGTSIPIDPSLPTAIYQAISDITNGSINSKVKGRDTTQLEKLIMDKLKNMGNNSTNVRKLWHIVSGAFRVKACADTAPFTLILKSGQLAILSLSRGDPAYLSRACYDEDNKEMIDTIPFFKEGRGQLDDTFGFCSGFDIVGFRDIRTKFFSIAPIGFTKGEFFDKEAAILTKSGIGTALSLSSNALSISPDQTAIFLLFLDAMKLCLKVFTSVKTGNEQFNECMYLFQRILNGGCIIDILTAKRLIEIFGFSLIYKDKLLHLIITNKRDMTQLEFPFDNDKTYFADSPLFIILLSNVLPTDISFNEGYNFLLTSNLSTTIKERLQNTMDLPRGIFESLLQLSGVLITTHADSINNMFVENILNTYFSGHDVKFGESARGLGAFSQFHNEELMARPVQNKRAMNVRLQHQALTTNEAEPARIFTKISRYRLPLITHVYNINGNVRLQFRIDPGMQDTPPLEASTEILADCICVSDLTVHHVGSKSINCGNPFEARSVSSPYVLSYRSASVIDVNCGPDLTYRCLIQEPTVTKVKHAEPYAENFLTSTIGSITEPNVKQFYEGIISLCRDNEPEEGSIQHSLYKICSDFKQSVRGNPRDISNRFIQAITPISKELYCISQHDEPFNRFLDTVRGRQKKLSIEFLQKSIALMMASEKRGKK